MPNWRGLPTAPQTNVIQHSAISISPDKYVGHDRERLAPAKHMERRRERLQRPRVANPEEYSERARPIRGAERASDQVVERLPSRIHDDLHLGIRGNLGALLGHS